MDYRRELDMIADEDQLLAREIVKKELDNAQIKSFMITDTLLYFDASSRQWCIVDLEQQPMFHTFSESEAIAYFVELEGSETVIRSFEFDDGIKIVVDDSAFNDSLT